MPRSSGHAWKRWRCRSPNGVTQPVSLRAAELAANLQRQGREIGTPDTFLAATAMTQGLVLVTRNVRHFERQPGLVVENWFAEA